MSLISLNISHITSSDVPRHSCRADVCPGVRPGRLASRAAATGHEYGSKQSQNLEATSFPTISSLVRIWESTVDMSEADCAVMSGKKYADNKSQLLWSNTGKCSFRDIEQANNKP
jgi:hypothetical protein